MHISGHLYFTSVAPFTGAWIETVASNQLVVTAVVAPFTGAWIETVAGLLIAVVSVVAPFTGAWIETAGEGVEMQHQPRRALHGRVD